MKRILLFVSIFFFLVLFPSRINAQAIAGEHIQDFDSKIQINKDGTMEVDEQIAYDFDSYSRHGIYRTIPYVKENKAGKRFGMDFTDISVTDENGKSYSYDVTKTDNTIKLKIGDANRTITGLHTYIIHYKVSGALSYFSDHDELYWNITGNEWTVPIESSKVEIRFPQSVGESAIKGACFTGYVGSTESLCDVQVQGTVLSSATQDVLSTSEGLTIVAGFPKGIVAILEPKEIISFFDTPFGKIVGALSILGFFIVTVFWYLIYPVKIVLKWIASGRDPAPPSGGPVSAWFDPPVDKNGRSITPAETGAVYDEKADLRDIFSMLVDFARRGYLTIREDKKNSFTLVKNKDSDSEMQPFEETFYNGIFGVDTEINLKTAKLAGDVTTAKENLYSQLVSDGFFEKSPEKTRTFYAVMWILALTTLNLPLFLAALIFGMNMPAKTVLGAEAKAVAQSLKNFLSSQERQLKFQAKKQMMFEKLLPYAIAFGVEKVWIERFEKMGIANPDWYEGYQGGRFNSVIFYHAMSSSYNSLNSAATPTSSSSGFSSGFSGGSSGGGGGGGGGGSW